MIMQWNLSFASALKKSSKNSLYETKTCSFVAGRAGKVCVWGGGVGGGGGASEMYLDAIPVFLLRHPSSVL